MRNPETCRHERFQAECRVQSDKTNEKYFLTARVKCSDCNTQFAFMGNVETICIEITPGVLPERNEVAQAFEGKPH